MQATVLSFPPFRLDVTDERLWKNGSEVKLRRKPFAILKYLATHPRRLVTQEELIEAVWGKVAMSESLLRTHVRAVRQALGDDTLIETVTRRGYRFLSDVQELREDLLRSAAPDLGHEVIPTLVGRSAELGALRTHLEAALQSRRQMVFVTGDPGIGKTALVEALLRDAASAGALVARGTCIEQYGSGEAYLPILGALGPICRGPHGMRVAELLGRHAPTWLTQLPGVAADDELASLQLRVQGATRARMLRELADALEILSAEVPVVLALDDLHWSDNSTTELLAMLGRRTEPARLLVVGTCRMTELARTDTVRKVVGELSAHRQAATVALELLSTEAVGEYVSVRWPGHGFPSLARTVHEATSGNPLFMVALLDDLESRQMIRAVDGSWQLSATEADIRSHRPDSVRQLIDIQIDRLAPEDQRVLEAAGAVGAEFTCGVVAHALEVAVDDVESCCEGFAEQARFLRYVGTETWPDGTLQARYAFVHALYRHAANARNSSAVTRLWHRRIGERLEAGFKDVADTIAGELATHFDAGQSFAQAIHYYDLAGLRAGRLSGGAEALAHFERARGLLPRLVETPDRDQLELRILRRLGRAAIAANALQNERLVPTFTRAAELARRLGDTASLGAALVGLQQCRMMGGGVREIDVHAAEVSEVAGRVGDSMLANWGRLMASAGALHQGRLLEAERGLSEGIASATVTTPPSSFDGPSFPYGPLLFSNLAQVEWLVGRPDAALSSALESVARAEALDDPFTLALGLAAAANVQMWRRDAKAALELAQRGMAVALEAGSGLGMARAASVFHLASVILDRASASVALGEIEAALSAHSSASPTARPYYSLFVAEIAARAGQVERALAELRESFAIAKACDERAWEPERHRLLGELQKATDKSAAERSFSTAIEVAHDQSSRSLELRAAISLHRLGAKKKTLERVRRLYESFTEGRATGDLVEAKRILDQSTSR
jgi:DNA-binding winged helix-turn-helix (wHTH) protein/tetratricopeptide (TPR) repeat protein